MAALPARVAAATSDYCRSHQMAVDPAVLLETTRKGSTIRNRRAADQMAKTKAHPAFEVETEYSEIGRQAGLFDQAPEAAGPGSAALGSVPVSVGPESVGPRAVGLVARGSRRIPTHCTFGVCCTP